MKINRIIIIILLFSVLLNTGCTGAVYSYDEFIDDLLDSGASIQIGGEVNLGFFSVQGRVARVNDELTNVFEYDNETLAEKDVAIVDPDGGGMHRTTDEGEEAITFSWVGYPHFYHKGRLIILYVDVSYGSDYSTRNLLENILGPQFVGVP